MKHPFKYIPVLLVAVMAITSCEKEIEINVPEHKSQLVISSLSETGDTIRVQVGRTAGIKEYRWDKNLNMSNATVVLYIADKLADTLEYDALNMYYTSDIVSETGKKYMIRAYAPSYTTAEATTTAADPVPLLSVKRIRNAHVTGEGLMQDELRLEFDDPAAIANYYIVRIIKESSSGETTYSFCLNVNDPSIESIYNEDIDMGTCVPSDDIFLKDALFNGRRKELRFFVDAMVLDAKEFPGDTAMVTVSLLSVSEGYYRYEKSYRYAFENEGNPFSEPVNVYTNVSNGYGIFGIISMSSRELE